jgi:hypothetical protein
MLLTRGKKSKRNYGAGQPIHPVLLHRHCPHGRASCSHPVVTFTASRALQGRFNGYFEPHDNRARPLASSNPRDAGRSAWFQGYSGKSQ